MVTCRVEAAQRAIGCQIFVILDALIGVQTSKSDGGRLGRRYAQENNSRTGGLMRRTWLFFRKSPLVAVLTAGIAFTLAVLGQALVGQLGQNVADKATTQSTWLTVVLIFILIVAIAILASLRGSVEELTRRAGLSIQYYPLDPGRHSPERDEKARALYAAARMVIESANEDGDSRIYAVNSFVEVGVQPGDAHVKDHSLRYLESLNRKLGKVAYHRIVQLSHFDMARLERHPDESIAELVAENYLAHYREIVKAGQQGKEAVLEAVLGKYPTCFVLVQNAADGKYGGRLIWQMHQHVDGQPREDIVELTGIYIINDPDGIFIGTFVRWFNDLRAAQRPRRHLTLANLNGTAPAEKTTTAAPATPRPRRQWWPGRRAPVDQVGER
ncbi:hypothetical protein ACFW0V_15835 [Micromonospora parva]|uniref:hypothetical protein n=1 Tax=Micromonospora parva TaxID=1464048 RepID=UPI00366D2BB4